MMSCPCYKCVCLIMCKRKHIRDIITQCQLIASYVRPYGSDRVDPFALKNTSEYLDRKFVPMYDSPSDETLTVIRDMEAYLKSNLHLDLRPRDKLTTIKRKNS